MATISVQTKKFADLETLLSVSDENMVLIHDGTGVKKISAKNLKADIQNIINQLNFPGAGAHNGIHRGKNLGGSVTPEQYATINAGTFDDLYIGDYWVIGGVNYRIAAFDYYYRSNENANSKHHVVIVPDTSLYNHVMNDTNTNAGGYVGSKMYTSGLTQAKNTINSAFGASHILLNKQFLTNAVANGKPTGSIYVEVTVLNMTERNVYGCNVFSPVTDGAGSLYNHNYDSCQFPLFAMNNQMIGNSQSYWLRDVVTDTAFCYQANGLSHYGNASSSQGVRPVFSIVA